MASKYHDLAAHLQWKSGHTFTMTFAAVAATLSPPALPRSASDRRSWWANDRGHTQARHGWLAAGWEVDTVDLAGRTVTFRRVPAGPWWTATPRLSSPGDAAQPRANGSTRNDETA